MDKMTKTYERVTDNHVFFWGGPMSNWFPSSLEMEVGGEKLKFSNTEQYFMYMKAKEFNDEENAKLILLNGSDPKAAKTLGRRVRNYDDGRWGKVRYDVMLKANMAKFTQNGELRKHILSDEFKGKGFVEGSPFDTIWGIGIDWKTAPDDESEWLGQNLLGKVLDEVRDTIQKEQTKLEDK